MVGDKNQEAAYRAADLMLFQTGRFADVLVTCGPKSWNLHRNILCTRSAWFETALVGSYVSGQMRAQQESFDGAIRIQEQNPEAVEVCLRYIYGGVAAIDMAEETRHRPTFKFCAELYRSADFFLLEPLLRVIQRHIGDYCDEKTKWMWTRGNITEDNRNGKKALLWIDDLKAAILETHKWNTPVIDIMLMEFVWAGRVFLTSRFELHINIRQWLKQNAKGWMEDMSDHCQHTPTFQGDVRKQFQPAVWTPARCKTPIPDDWCDTCVRCGTKLDRDNFGLTKRDYGQLRDLFNSSSSCIQPREWCRACAAETKYPWREEGYL